MIRLALAFAAFSMVGAIASCGAEPTADVATTIKENPFRDKIVTITGGPVKSIAYFENARVETVFGRQMFVGEHVHLDGSDPENTQYVPTGVERYISWELLTYFTAKPSAFFGQRIDPRSNATENAE